MVRGGDRMVRKGAPAVVGRPTEMVSMTPEYPTKMAFCGDGAAMGPPNESMLGTLSYCSS